ncbi:uncharacterized protein LOC125242042 [Leguminivora glycinivorella]|uniref:uncharacterized protein LOC125242042 n=1 Tax=Leguminivora glycinivorella TaxID=1035111 RepID=UPI00200EDA68|nr:uncharacterized protein LOC125242042 [Leguminivora glycinivorella]
MTNLLLFVFLSIFLTFVNAQELSSLIRNTNLGRIDPVTDKKILNAVVRANPNLNEYPDLRDTTSQGLLYVSVKYQDNRHAIIGVISGPSPYSGYVEVTFNGGPLPTSPSSPLHQGSGKLNLSRFTELNRNLGLPRD